MTEKEKLLAMLDNKYPPSLDGTKAPLFPADKARVLRGMLEDPRLICFVKGAIWANGGYSLEELL